MRSWIGMPTNHARMLLFYFARMIVVEKEKQVQYFC